MRYSLEPNYRKYVKGYGFLSFARTFRDKYGKKINGYCDKNRNRCSKDCFQKSSSENRRKAGDLVGNKIADKITSADEPKRK